MTTEYSPKTLAELACVVDKAREECPNAECDKGTIFRVENQSIFNPYGDPEYTRCDTCNGTGSVLPTWAQGLVKWCREHVDSDAFNSGESHHRTKCPIYVPATDNLRSRVLDAATALGCAWSLDCDIGENYYYMRIEGSGHASRKRSKDKLAAAISALHQHVCGEENHEKL